MHSDQLCSQSMDQINRPTCFTPHERSDPIWNVSCSTTNRSIILLWTQLFFFLYPASGCPYCPAQSGRNAGATRAGFRHPFQMLHCCPPLPSLNLLCLVSLIQATSWSWPGLISFTPREELDCGQTAYYGDDPAALQVTN